LPHPTLVLMAAAEIPTPPERPAKIVLRGVSKSFGPKVVLDACDLEIAEGESVVIIGGSGTGKSVLLKHIIGLLKPDSGSVRVDGIDIASLDHREITTFRRRFRMAFQEGALFDSMSVFENVAFPLRRGSKMGESEVRARVEECLGLVRLARQGTKAPSELSGGMRRRVGFARAIALKPQIMLFDEPNTGLDPVIKALIEDTIVNITGELAP